VLLVVSFCLLPSGFLFDLAFSSVRFWGENVIFLAAAAAAAAMCHFS
jgi:hypothetical protein